MTVQEQIASTTAVADQQRNDKVKVKAFTRGLMKVLKLDKVKDVYRESTEHEGAEFIDLILKKLGVSYEYKEEELDPIPKFSSFILVANHPYGGIDGLILLALLLRRRPDFKIMANYLLETIPQLNEFIVPVDPFEKKRSGQVNIAAIKKSLQLLSNGMPIGVFPAGEVSSFDMAKMKVSDKAWHPVMGKMIMKAQVPVVPVFFSGHNSFMFNILGMIHPKLRTAKLASELFNKSEKIIVRIGRPIPPETLQEFEHPDQLLRFIRAKTYALGSALEVKQQFWLRPGRNEDPDAVIDETKQHLLLEDLERIKTHGDLLFTHGAFSVFISEAVHIPNILREISRQREIAFREVGEGTGYGSDSDEFDLYYKHLFLWDHELNRIAGAYRLGEGHRIFKRFKKKGFYLNQLFRFSHEFDEIFSSSLELGRSFIVKEYQRRPYTLLLLWKGIHEFLKRKKKGRYKYLIGPVSISSSYSNLSRDLIVDYISKNHFDHELASYVKPRKGYHYKHRGEGKDLLKSGTKTLQSLDQLISDIEPQHTKIPVLIKKYLKQNARIIAFNIDPKFNRALDGLLVMKIRDIPEETFQLID